jgi:AAA domain
MSEIIAIYPYQDCDGKLLYEKVRLADKRFLQRQPDGKGGWTYNLAGVKPVPYRLPELFYGVFNDLAAFVILTEGEKDCDNVRRLGFPAVSSFKDWKREFNTYIRNRMVFLLADKDVAGQRMANEAAAVISQSAAGVAIVDLFPQLDVAASSGFDVSDWLRDIEKHGGSSEEGPKSDLLAALEAAPRWSPESSFAHEFRPVLAETAGLFKRKPGAQWLGDALEMPPARMLFGEFWHEGELCILFADTNTGKSILGVQICQSIASGTAIGGFGLQTAPQKVIYFDFELSERQFLTRYAAPDGDRFRSPFLFHENFERVEIDPLGEIPDGVLFEDLLYRSLEDEIVLSGAKVVVIDNITFLRSETERAKDALPLMKQLKRLKQALGLSILVLAHTPKRSPYKPLDRNDLQGSKMIISFCDAAFAIGESSRDRRLRYLKQIKERNTPKIYHEDNVPVAEIVRDENFLRFEFGTEFGKEREHLKQPESDNGELLERVKALRGEGKSFKEISQQLGIHYKKAERLVTGS